MSVATFLSLCFVAAATQMVGRGWMKLAPVRSAGQPAHVIASPRPHRGVASRIAKVNVTFASVVLAAVSSAVFTIPLGVLSGVAVFVGQRTRDSRTRKRLADRGEQTLIDLFVDVSQELRTGQTPIAAVSRAAERHPGIIALDVALTRSDDIGEVLSYAANQGGGSLLPLLCVGAQFGLHASYVDSVVSSARDQRAIRQEIRALSDQAMYSGWVLLVGPLLFAGLLSGTDAGARRFLTGTTLGAALLGIALLLEFAGFRWMKKLVANVEAM